MQHFLYSLADFFAPKPVRRSPGLHEKLINCTVIQATNECGEKRYIEIPGSRPRSQERRENLEVLLTKCNRLLSFVMKKDRSSNVSSRIIALSDRIRMSMHKDDDITHLITEFEEFEQQYNKKSRSYMNLSSAYLV
jgi:hypothetical protein